MEGRISGNRLSERPYHKTLDWMRTRDKVNGNVTGLFTYETIRLLDIM